MDFLFESILKHPLFKSYIELYKSINLDTLRKIIEKNFLIKKIDTLSSKDYLFLASDASSRSLKLSNPLEIIFHLIIALSNNINYPQIEQVRMYPIRPGIDISKNSKLLLIFEEIEKQIQYPIKNVLQEKLTFMELLFLYELMKKSPLNTLALSDGSYEVNLKKALLYLIRREKVYKLLKNENLSQIEKYHKEMIFEDIKKEEIDNFQEDLEKFLRRTLFVPKKITSFFILENIKKDLPSELKNILFDHNNPLMDDVSLLNICLDNEEVLILKLPYKYLESNLYMNVLKNKLEDLSLNKDIYRIYIKTHSKIFIFETLNPKLFLDEFEKTIKNLIPLLEEDGEVQPIKIADRMARDLSKRQLRMISYQIKFDIFKGMVYRENDLT